MGTKQKKGSMTNLDRISELSNDLKEMILVRLPIKEAAKTSCLSSEWRYAWSYIPDLVFIEDPHLTSDPSARASKLTKLVDTVLLLHQGPIRKFSLRCSYLYHLNDAIHRWILILSRNEIKELEIGAEPEFIWKMPSSIFTTSSLTNVAFGDCVLKLPRLFNGLQLLKSLLFVSCSIGDKDLESLISSCPHLESLVLAQMDSMVVRISAPKLKYIHLDLYGLKCIELITPILEDAIFNMEYVVEQNSYNNIMKDAFGSLCNIKRLHIGYLFMEFLANSSNMELPVKFTCLKKLILCIDPSSQKENDFAVCMFQNAPSLDTLKIFAHRDEPPTEMFWETTMPTILFENLKIVKIRYNEEHIANFILPHVKLLLATSPVLVSLRLVGPAAHENVVGLNKLLGFKRASREAQIFVESISIDPPS